MGGARGCWRFVVGDADFADSPLIILLLVCASAIGLTGLRAKKSPVIFLLFFFKPVHCRPSSTHLPRLSINRRGYAQRGVHAVHSLTPVSRFVHTSPRESSISGT